MKLDYERDERIAIRMDSGLSEAEARRLTDAEQPKPIPECIARLNQIQRRVNLPKPVRKFEYE